MACECLQGKNTGIPSCSAIPSIAKQYIIVPTFGSDGNFNSIASGTVVDDAYIQAKLNAENPNDRWYPIPGELLNVEDVRGDNVTEEAGNGRTAFIQTGTRTVTAEIWDDPIPQLQGKLEGHRCSQFSLFTVDRDGNLIGVSTDKFQTLRPIRINKDSWAPVYIKPTDTTTAKIQLNFQWSNLDKDSDITLFVESDIEADLSTLQGVIDLNVIEIVAPTLTEFTVDLQYDYGAFGKPEKYVGGTAPDFVLKNVSQGTTVTIDTLTEIDDGRYTFEYSVGVASTDVLTLESDYSGVPSELVSTGFEVVAGTNLTAIP
jgi:hypothetical protein